MKAILIKDDRDIKFWDVRERCPEFYLAKNKPISNFVKEDTEISQDSIQYTKEVYELICIRKNGDLVYRLKR